MEPGSLKRETSFLIYGASAVFILSLAHTTGLGYNESTEAHTLQITQFSDRVKLVKLDTQSDIIL